MYYQLSSKGLKYEETKEDSPKAATIVLDALATQTTPADISQIARALRKTEAETLTALDYLIRQDYVTQLSDNLAKVLRKQETKKTVQAITKPTYIGLHNKSIEELVEQELKERQAHEKWARSEKGKKSRAKYENGKGKLARRKYQQGPKYKAAYERCRSKLKLAPKGLAKLQEKKWSKEHDLLAFIQLERPTKEQLSESGFERLRKSQYI